MGLNYKMILKSKYQERAVKISVKIISKCYSCTSENDARY